MSSTVSNESLETLLARLQIDQWDLLLIGDGSGSTWERECGWGCVSVERATFERRVWHGALSHGTVNLAEAMAYLPPLCWYVDRELKNRKAGNKVTIRHVHIVTDSTYLANSGKRPTIAKRNGNSSPVWNVFRQFSSHGILLHWHWIRRDTIELNRFVDRLSKTARLHAKEVSELTVKSPQLTQNSIYNFNPSE